MKNGTYGVGIIGFGFIGKVHAYSYINIPLFYDPPPLRTKLVGVCTSREETARKAKEVGGFEFATTDFMEIMERDDIDIVNICTPNRFHREEILAAIRSGKHIYCDKPLAFSSAEADEIAEALRGYDRVHQMTLQNRFLPATMRAKQLVDEGFLGEPISFRAVYLHSGSVDRDKPLSWKLDRRMGGGGVLYDLGPHVLDLIFHLIGEPERVFAETGILFEERPSPEDPSRRVKVEAEDLAILMLRMKSGALGTVECSKIATGTNDELRFEIHGTGGAMRFNLMEPNWLEIYDATRSEGPIGGRRGFTRVETVGRYPRPAGFPGPKFSVGWIRAHMACLYNFLSAIAEGRGAEPSLLVGAKLQRFMDRAYLSASEKRWMDVSDI